MHLKPLYDAQKALMEHIEKEHPTKPGENRFYKKILALLVEVGECANEWRGFKFWKVNPQPTTKLLEEYVDGLHFVLEIGIDKGFVFNDVNILMKCQQIEEQFIYIMDIATDFISLYKDEQTYLELVKGYLGLGEMLGFTTDQIHDAYTSKNKVNHDRQNSGY